MANRRCMYVLAVKPSDEEEQYQLAVGLIFEKREAAIAFAVAKRLMKAKPVELDIWEGYHGTTIGRA